MFQFITKTRKSNNMANIWPVSFEKMSVALYHQVAAMWFSHQCLWLQRKKKKNLPSPDCVFSHSSCRGYNPVKHSDKICALPMLVHDLKHGFLLSAYAIPFFLLYSVDSILTLTLVHILHSSSLCTARDQPPGDWMKTSLSLFSIFLDKAILKNPFLIHRWSFCTLN